MVRTKTTYQLREEVSLQNVPQMAEIFDTVNDEAETYILGSLKRAEERLRLLNKYTKFVKVQHPTFVGREWALEGLERRLLDFLTYIVEHSVGRVKREKMMYSSLLSVRELLLKLWNDATDADPVQRRVNSEKSYLWSRLLKDMYKLRCMPVNTDKSVLRSDEIKMLIAQFLTKPKDSNNSIQHAMALCIELLTGVRPSTLYSSRGNKHAYLTVKDVKLFRTEKRYTFKMVLTFRWFKGHMTGNPLIVNFTLRSATDLANLELDPVTYAIVLGFRLKRFKVEYDTFTDFLDGDDHWIQWKDEVLDYPWFVASTPRGYGLKLDTPMSSEAHIDFMQKAAIACGLGGSEAGITPYALRRGFATKLFFKVCLGELSLPVLRQAMGHAPGSNTYRHYVQHNQSVDFTGLMLDEEVFDAAAMTSNSDRALFVIDNTKAPKLSDELLRIRVPVLCDLERQAKELRACIEGGNDTGDEWRQYISDMAMFDDEDDAYMVLAWTNNRIRQLTQRAQKKFLEEWRIGEHENVRKNMTISELKRRKEELERLSIADIVHTANQETDGSRKRKRHESEGDYDIENAESDDEADDEDGDPVVVEAEITCVKQEDEEDPDKIRQQYFEDLIMMPRAFLGNFTCELCIDDWTCSEENARHNWRDDHDLEKHKYSLFHDPKARVQRLIELQDWHKGKKWYECPSCSKRLRSISTFAIHVYEKHGLDALDQREADILSEYVMVLQGENEPKDFGTILNFGMTTADIAKFLGDAMRAK